ncbi:MAG: acetyl-CoA carboxylase biotin carboxyl carrier protein subunit [Rhodoferax sp.]|nr:acetyl-CoA carboxylase biotin carboxyl carrier protein subunit [Rhodoferax sp.]
MPRQFKVSVNGREYDVSVLEVTPGNGVTLQTSATPVISAPPAAATVAPSSSAPPAPPAPSSAAPSAGAGDEVAQMGGVVVQVEVKVGQTVATGDRLLVLEAMKMKTHVFASRPGKVTRILVAAGDSVEGGQPLVSIE